MKKKNKEIDKLKGELERASKSVNIKEQEFLQQEKNSYNRFKENIKGYMKHKKYENLQPYLEIITDKNAKINCLVIKGEQGIGKSSVIKNLMKEMGKEVFYMNSYTTGLAFYKALYNNRFKHIIIDDVVGLYESEKGISILRAITNTEKIRYVKYESTSDKLDVPSSFVFEGSITILTNKITDKMDKSLLDRAIFRELNFTLQEKIEFVGKIIKFNYKNLKSKEVEEIIKYVEENVDETTNNFTFRSILRICEFYIHKKICWKELARDELQPDGELIIVKDLINKYKSVKKQIREFEELTGKSRRTFFRLKKKLNKKVPK